MHTETGRILLSLFVIFASGKLAGELFERLRQPAVIGELVVGVVLGSSVLGLVTAGAVEETMATIGVVVLLFCVGLETRTSDLFRVGRTATIVATLGVLLPFVLGYGYMRLLGETTKVALFVGAALVATSVGITARVLTDTGLITSREARIILAAAVIDDILGLLILAGVSGFGTGGLDLRHLALVAAEAAAFIAFQVFVVPRLIAHRAEAVNGMRASNSPLAVAIATLLGLSALAEFIGLAAIVGAFFAGMAFAETREQWSLETHTRPLYDFLVPFFFVVAGTKVDVRLLVQPAVLVPGIVLAVIAVASKIVGCGVGALGEGLRPALAVGVGMVPRGEVGLIVAAVGLSAGIVPPDVYAMVVFVAIATTVFVPPILPRLIRPAAPAADQGLVPDAT